MFAQASVCPHRGEDAPWQTPPGQTPFPRQTLLADTPYPSRHPLAIHPRPQMATEASYWNAPLFIFILRGLLTFMPNRFSLSNK